MASKKNPPLGDSNEIEVGSDMYGWVTVANGKPCLVGLLLNDRHTPLVAMSRETVEKMRALAVMHAKMLRQPVRLVRFAEVETLEAHEAGSE